LPESDPVIFWLGKKYAASDPAKGLRVGIASSSLFARLLPESDPVIFWLSKKYAASDPAKGLKVQIALVGDFGWRLNRW
jgi:hypothetical protein